MRSVSAAKRLTAALFIGAMLVFGLAGVAGAQSGGGSGGGSGCASGASGAGCTTVPTVTVTTAKPATPTTAAIGGSTLPRTGGDLWIPLSAGGAAVAIAVAARRVSRRSIV